LLTRNRSKRRRSRWIVVLVICFAIGFIMFARARGEKAPAGQPDGAAFTRAVPVTAVAARKCGMPLA
jgi:hypothetical protein